MHQNVEPVDIIHKRLQPFSNVEEPPKLSGLVALTDGWPCMQSPGQDFLVNHARAKLAKRRIILVRHAATVSTEENLLPNSVDEPCSSLGEVQAIKLGEFLMDTCIDTLVASPAERTVFTASAVAKCQSLVGDRAPRLQLQDDLANLNIGEFAGMQAREV
jgi:hypothetical protein